MKANHEFIKIPQNTKEQFVIFGTGKVAVGIIKDIEKNYDENKIDYYIDSSRKEVTFEGKRVYRLDEISQEMIQNRIFIIASYTKSDVMKKLLINRGVNQENIIAAKNYFDYKSLQYGNDKIDRILIYPALTSKEMLESVVENINWYLANDMQEIPEIRIIVEKGLELDKTIERKNVSVLDNEQDYIKDVNFIFVHDSRSLFAINKEAEIYCFDQNVVERIDIRMWLALSYRLLKNEIKEKYHELSKENFIKMKNAGKDKKGAVAVGTGPSLEMGLDKLEKIGMQQYLKIVCNRMVTSKEIIQRINPDLYTFLTTFTVEKRNEESLKLVIDYIKNHDCILVVPDYFLSVILKLSILEKIILVQIEASHVCFPKEDNITVCREMGGVMTGIVLPFASAFCKQVYLVGCDGKLIDKNKKGQVDAFETHSKFNFNWSGALSKTDIESIILLMEQHKDIFEYGEKIGNIYQSITHSHNRYVEERFNDNIV